MKAGSTPYQKGEPLGPPAPSAAAPERQSDRLAPFGLGIAPQECRTRTGTFRPPAGVLVHPTTAPGLLFWSHS